MLNSSLTLKAVETTFCVTVVGLRQKRKTFANPGNLHAIFIPIVRHDRLPHRNPVSFLGKVPAP